MLSLVIPVYNEADSLPQLFKELNDVAQANHYDLDVIFVDDGSTDTSWKTISDLAASDPRVRGIRFRRNFGKAAALNAGFKVVRGDMVMTLDADLQDDPHEIPKFLEKMASGFDVVSGWKRVRHDPWHKVGPSRIFNALVSWLTGVTLHDHNCGMKCYRREVLSEVRLYGELHRFVPVLAAAKGFRVGELVIQHRPRQHGYSKFGVERFVKGFLDLLTVKFLTHYGRRPSHLFGTIGLVFLAWGIFRYGIWRLLGWAPLVGFTSDPAMDPQAQLVNELALRVANENLRLQTLYFWVILAFMFFLTGLIAELVVAQRSRDDEGYSISERVPS